MSVDTIATVISAATLLLGFFGAFGWMIRRIDGVEQRLGARIDGVEEKLSARIDGVEEKLSARIDGVEEKLGARIDKVDARIGGVERELVEVKIAVARIEGPPRHLLSAR
ncbi:hypothetical protein [Microbacterium sp. 18062]|uniref:hypothetical protein n=1 Tax=Microbacterium sp. 18062 TaxID=2681410 RepID=UPI00135C83D8|nr:hypothetical protein [Microbacterium sp. 18062]